ncbi:MAG: hypothetical protein IJU92_04405 [Spirochaetaceae bacterium]|nr:hypothetical protein [Spirochaetaceae bacterium]
MKKFLLLLTVLVTVSCASVKPLSQDRIQVYEQLVSVTNQDLPLTVDEVTVLDRVEFSESERTLDYIYTLGFSGDDLSQSQIQELKSQISYLVQENMKNNNTPAVAMYRSDKLNIRHRYYDSNGKELITVVVPAGSY